MGYSVFPPPQAQQLPLRTYQQDCLNTILSKFKKGINRQLISIACGGGKTVLFSSLIKEMGVPTLVLAHRDELLTQAKEKIEMIYPEANVGIVNGLKKEFDKDVIIASVQSASNPATLAKLKQKGFRLLVIDECHYARCRSYRAVIEELDFNGKDTSKLLLGVTATPFRNDGLGLGEVFQEITFEKTIKELIEEGYLCQPIGVNVKTNLDLRELASSRSDYASSGLSAIMNTQDIRAITVAAYQQHAVGKSAICFCCSIDHAQNLSDDFNIAGVSSATICGTTKIEDRKRILSDYKNGKVSVLTNCSVLTEGWDCPQTACVVVARPTKSRGLHTQMIGRGLRLFPNKSNCIVIDFCDVNHSLCNTSVLSLDAEIQERKEIEQKKRTKELLKELPSNLNKELKHAYVAMNLLSIDGNFQWERTSNGFSLVALHNNELRIIQEEELYYVIFSSVFADELICERVPFEYAFAAAEEYARKNRNKFILSDKAAAWRKETISPKQINIFKNKNYRAGVKNLTKGVASDLIQSGALRRVRK